MVTRSSCRPSPDRSAAVVLRPASNCLVVWIRARQREQDFPRRRLRRINHSPIDPLLSGLRRPARLNHATLPANRENRSSAAEVEAGVVFELGVCQGRDAEDVARGVLTGESPELKRMLARLEGQVTFA